MFLRKDYRDRALGLMAAFLLLITAIVASGAIEPAPAAEAPRIVASAPAPMWSGDCSSPMHDRSDTICYTC